MSEPTSVTTEREDDLYSQPTKDNPYPVFAQMCRENPVYSHETRAVSLRLALKSARASRWRQALLSQDR